MIHRARQETHTPRAADSPAQPRARSRRDRPAPACRRLGIEARPSVGRLRGGAAEGPAGRRLHRSSAVGRRAPDDRARTVASRLHVRRPSVWWGVAGGSGGSRRTPTSRPWSQTRSITHPFSSSFGDAAGDADREIIRPACVRSPRVAVSLSDSRRQAPVRQPLAANPPMPAPSISRERFGGPAHIEARDGSRVERRLALRPGFSAQARMSPTA